MLSFRVPDIALNAAIVDGAKTPETKKDGYVFDGWYVDANKNAIGTINQWNGGQANPINASFNCLGGASTVISPFSNRKNLEYVWSKTDDWSGQIIYTTTKDYSQLLVVMSWSTVGGGISLNQTVETSNSLSKVTILNRINSG